MTPCRKCKDEYGNSGYSIELVYGWFASSTYGYYARCQTCGSEAPYAITQRGAWENWDKKNREVKDENGL